MRPRPKKSSAPPPTSNATRRILRQCRLRRHHTAHLWRFAPYGSCYAHAAPLGRHTAPPHGYALVAYGNAASIRRACALCSRCLRQRGEHTRALQAPHGGAFFAYGAPCGDAIRLILRLWRPQRATPYGSVARLCSRCLRQRSEHTPCAFNRLRSPFCRRN